MTKTHTASTMKNEWIEIIGASDKQLISYAKQYAIPDDYLSGVNDEFEIARMEETPHQAGQRPTLVLLQYMLAETGPSGFPEFNTHAISLIDTGDKIITALETIPDILNASKMSSTVKSSNDFPKYCNLFSVSFCLILLSFHNSNSVL